MRATASAVQDSFEANEEPVYLGEFQVQFEQGNPCRPRYPDLYRYPAEKGQVEPAFQIAGTVPQVSLVLALESDMVELMPDPTDPTRPLCREWGQKETDEDLQVTHPGGDKSRCKLVWNTQDSTLKAYKVYCKKKGKKDEQLTKEEKVDGGIIVVFSTYSAKNLGKEIQPPPHEHTDHHRIHLLGADAKGRPIYDIHENVHSVIPPGIEIEPAYRLRWQQETLSFSLFMRIEGAVWENKVICPQPGGRPAELTYQLTDEDKKFHFSWNVADLSHAITRVTTFQLVPKLGPGVSDGPLPPGLEGWGTWERYAEALSEVGTDPVIIQPPVCDPMFSCTESHPCPGTAASF